MSADEQTAQASAALPEAPDASEAKRRRQQARLTWLVTLGVSAALVWHVHARIDPQLIYHGDLLELPSQQSFLVAPLFDKGGEFFEPFLTRPGGLTEYAGAYLFQYLSMPFVGTLILIVPAALVFLITNRIVTTMSGRAATCMGFWPALLLVMIWGRYVFHLSDCLAMGVALLACWATLRLGRPTMRAVALTLGTAVLYYVIGAPALLFAGMCGLAELIRGRQWWLGVLALAVGAAAPLVVGVWVFGSTAPDAYLRLSGPYPLSLRSNSGASHWTRVAGWLAIYGTCLLAVLLGGLAAWWTRRKQRNPGAWWASPSALKGVAPSAVVMATVAVLFLAFDTEARSLLQIHRYALDEQWPELLEETRRHPLRRYSYQAVREINRALAEEGQLGSKMFAYPQGKQSLFAPMTATHQSVTECRTSWRLGMINQAESLAAELRASWGTRPELMRVLAEIFICKGESDSAKVFLNQLAKDVIHGDWAEQTLEKLRTDPLLLDDETITRHRAMMPTVEVIDHTYSGMLLGLANEDPVKYRMAFEYLMGAQLLDPPREQALLVDHYRGIASLMARFVPEMDYDPLPKHYAEAWVLFAALTNQDYSQGPFRIDPSTAVRFRRSFEVMQIHGGNLAAVDRVLADEMPGSYFRYFTTGTSGGAPQE